MADLSLESLQGTCDLLDKLSFPRLGVKISYFTALCFTAVTEMSRGALGADDLLGLHIDDIVSWSLVVIFGSLLPLGLQEWDGHGGS